MAPRCAARDGARWPDRAKGMRGHVANRQRQCSGTAPRAGRGVAVTDGAGDAGELLEMRDVAPGLWLWRVRHPGWQPGVDWEPVVSSVCVESQGEVGLIDPIAPSVGAEAFWARLDARPPTFVVVLKPDHVRDVDLFARRYGVPAFGPDLFYRGEAPETELEPIHPGDDLPGGLIVQTDGRIHHDTPLWLPGQRALVFADSLTERGGQLRVWSTPWDEEGPRRALGQLLRLPFRHVLISHGEPVHDRRAYEQALELPPWAPTLELPEDAELDEG